MQVNQENGFSRANALSRNRYPAVPDDPAPHFYEGSCSAFSIVKPLGVDLINYVANPSFERGTLGWYPSSGTINLTRDRFGISGGYRLTATPGAAGAYSVMYAADSSASGFTLANLPQNQTMYACAWVRATKGNKISLSLFFDGVFGGMAPYALEGKQVSAIATGQWQRVCCSYTATARFPTGVTVWPLGLKIENDNAYGGNLQVDAATMTIGQQSEYFDGDSGSGFGWAGAAHASLSIASRFSRTYGTTENFVDLGFDIYSDAGWGYTPVENITTSFAMLDGAHYQRTRLLPRTLTLTAVINSCCSPTKVHRARKALIDAMTYRFSEICTDEMLMIYQVRSECCGALSYPIGIRCVYQSGMEGLRVNPYFEKVTLSFIANNDPTFFDIYETSVVLSNANLTGTTIYAAGNAPMYPILELRAGANPVTINRIINDTPQFTIALGVPAVGYTLNPGQYLIIDTDPRSFSATLYPAGTSILSQVNFPSSNAAGRSMMIPGTNSWRADWATSPGDQELLVRWRNRYVSADSLTYIDGCSLCCGNN